VKFRKTLEHVYLKYLGQRFNQWHLQMKSRDEKAFILEKTIICKMERRIKRVAFDLYREKTFLVRWLEHERGQVEKVSSILQYRSKKRMFMAIRKFTRNHRTATKFLRATIKQADLRGKKKFFTQWKQDHEADK
jgi:hypothetical protein